MQSFLGFHAKTHISSLLRPHSPKLNWSECGWEEREEGWGMSFRPAHSARPHGWLLATTDAVYDWLSKPRQFRELMYAL